VQQELNINVNLNNAAGEYSQKATVIQPFVPRHAAAKNTDGESTIFLNPLLLKNCLFFLADSNL
jgi:hypothetical protein